MDQGSQQPPPADGAPEGSRQPVQSQALHRGAHAFLELMRNDPVIKRYVMAHNKTPVHTADPSEAQDSVVAQLQQELGDVKKELALTRKALSDALKELESARKAHSQDSQQADATAAASDTSMLAE